MNNSGLSDNVIATVHAIFKQYPSVEKAVLYGSRAKGNYKNGSDIDLTLIGEDLTYDDLLSISGDLDDSFIPHQVDLSIFDRIDNAKLREHIERVGVVFYERAEKMVGWELRTLGEVCKIVNGGTPKTNVPTYWFGQHLWITPAEMGKLKSPYISDTERKITDAGLKNSSASLLPKYSIILSSRAPIGHLVINTNSMATNQGCKGLIPSNRLNYKYLYYYLFSKVDLLNSLGTGTTFKELSGGKLKEVAIPLAPLQEQQSIVAILDEVFAGIAKAKENIERNLQSARDVFESYLQSVFANAGDDWEEERLGDVCEELFAGGDVQKDRLSRTKTDIFNIPIFTNGEKNKGLYGYTNIARVTKPSITISARGTIGYSEIREESFYPAIRLIVVTPKTNIISLSFLKFVISGIDFTHSGTSIPQLTVPMIKEYKISLPPIDEQQAIVTKLDSIAAETKQLESIYRQKIAHLEELKKSVLQKAFSGELTAVANEIRAIA